MEKLRAFVSKIDSDEARELLAGLVGEEGCCWGNPCYRKECLACFCRGNIKYLTPSQAFVQDGSIQSTDTHWKDRNDIVFDAEVDDDLTDYMEHLSGSNPGIE